MTAKILTIVGVVISATLIVTSPRPAIGAEINELLVYPGVNCRVTGGGPASFNGSGWLVNNNLVNMTVQCPMYDNGNNFTGNVWVLDNSMTANVSCCSKLRYPNGAGADQCKSTSGNSSSAMALSFSGPDAGGNFSFGFRFYQCTLPPTTAVISYRGCAIRAGQICAPK
jgi:hypothetical protein